DATGERLRVLRPGAVLVDRAAALAGDAVGVAPAAAAGTGAPGAVPRVPGSHSTHYAPAAEVVIANEEELLAAWAPMDPDAGSTGFLAPAGIETPAGWLRLASPADDVEFAAVLYRGLRAADDAGLHRIVVVPPTTGGLLPAILDRLRRAAR
ncbi:MAG TPA: Sua5 family C-terminal domain-containing protein, partial [Actinomycetota bacterium]|nr:Sua5 family C-terminal domain-containing protein [Actinomycetota bacterium]